MKKGKLARKIGIWALSLLLAFAFASNGSGKFTGQARWEERFQTWGYPDGFVYVVGGTEVVSAMLLLVPGLAPYGAMGLGVVMLGASATHMLHGEPFVSNMVFLALLSLVFWSRRPAWFWKHVAGKVTRDSAGATADTSLAS